MSISVLDAKSTIVSYFRRKMAQQDGTNKGYDKVTFYQIGTNTYLIFQIVIGTNIILVK